MRRREFLSWAGRSWLTALVGSACAVTGPGSARSEDSSQTVVYVPGYKPRAAGYQGQPLLRHPRLNKAVPRGYDGPVTMLTRVAGPEEPLRRALFPIRGHAVSVRGGVGFFNSMNRDNMLSFDPESLEMISLVSPHGGDGWVGGGHGAFTADGRHLLATERRRYAPFSGRPSDHFGMITVRDPKSLKVLATFSCHGIAPHEIGVMADAKHVAVANYGSTQPPGVTSKDTLRHMVEPCVTILELESGRLVHKIHAPDVKNEIRHLAAHSLRRTMVIQARVGATGDDLEYLRENQEIYAADFTARPNTVYLPAPVLRLAAGGNATPRALPISARDPLLMRHGLSIVYDPAFDEFIATFPTPHCFMVFDGANGAIKRIVRAVALGLAYPSGLALHPDGQHYVVTGSWRGLYTFRRGSHDLNRQATSNPLFLGHSHIVVA